ncbi:hypothetical protein YB2330_001935 [Saitoella coloradoensis]
MTVATTTTTMNAPTEQAQPRERVGRRNSAAKRLSSIFSHDSATTAVTTNTAEKQEDLFSIADHLGRLNSPSLADKQRFFADAEKEDTLKTLAMTAKLDRALERRLGNQDAKERKGGFDMIAEEIVLTEPVTGTAQLQT